MKTNLVLVMLSFALLSTAELEAEKKAEKFKCQKAVFTCNSCSKTLDCICPRDGSGNYTGKCDDNCLAGSHDCQKKSVSHKFAPGSVKRIKSRMH